MSDMDQIKADIVVTKAKLVEAEKNGDRDLILVVFATLAEQQKKENILLASAGN